MKNELSTQKSPNTQNLLTSLPLSDYGIDEAKFRVIKEILYPNVLREETLFLALSYCKARNLDIMKRPIQIVPIWNSKSKKMEDTIWPSITEIRITAARTGEYMGRNEAEFGEEVTENLGGVEITFPKWCKVTVLRGVQGNKCEFTSQVFWKETYKTEDSKSRAPNAMWKKRPFSQLEKCAEAAALRAAFPEELGNDYIAEEAFDRSSNEVASEQNNLVSAPIAGLPKPKVFSTNVAAAPSPEPIAPEVAIETQPAVSYRENNLTEEIVEDSPDFEDFQRQQIEEEYHAIINTIKTLSSESAINGYVASIRLELERIQKQNEDFYTHIKEVTKKKREEVRSHERN